MSLEEVATISRALLAREGLDERQRELVVGAIVAGERDECASHGLYRLPGCIHTIRANKVSRIANPSVEDRAPSIVRVDGDGGFAQLGFAVGRPLLEQKAAATGMAALIINHCVHFAALWPEVEALARAGFAALACKPSQARVVPAGGRKPLLGTNPIAFGWPRPTDPFVFDFATSAVARGEIELHARAGEAIPIGWGVGPMGEPTTDAALALAGAMLPFGGHKGSAISIMIELLGASLIGDLTSAESLDFDNGAGALPYGGELIIAFDPKRFLPSAPSAGHAGAEALFDAIVGQGARLPSQRRYEARKRTPLSGVNVAGNVYREVMQMLDEAPVGQAQDDRAPS